MNRPTARVERELSRIAAEEARALLRKLGRSVGPDDGPRAELTWDELEVLDQLATGKVRRGALRIIREIERARAKRTEALRRAAATAADEREDAP